MAYVDPGAGSLLLQLISAGVVGGLFYFRKSLAVVGRFFRRLRHSPRKPPNRD